MQQSAIVVLFLLLAVSTAWWDVGHMLTAAIAESKLNELDPDASVRFREVVASMNWLSD